MYFSRACIFREFRVFFFKREIFMSRNVSCNSLKTDYKVPHAISSLVDTRPRSHAPLLLNVKDSETVVTASVLNPDNIKMNLHYIHPRTIRSLSVKCMFTTCIIRCTFQYGTREHLRLSVIRSFDAVD